MLGIQNGRGRMKIIYNLTEALSNMNNVFSFSLYSIPDSTGPVVVVAVGTYVDDFQGIAGIMN